MCWDTKEIQPNPLNDFICTLKFVCVADGLVRKAFVSAGSSSQLGRGGSQAAAWQWVVLVKELESCFLLPTLAVRRQCLQGRHSCFSSPSTYHWRAVVSGKMTGGGKPQINNVAQLLEDKCNMCLRTRARISKWTAMEIPSAQFSLCMKDRPGLIWVARLRAFNTDHTYIPPVCSGHGMCLAMGSLHPAEMVKYTEGRVGVGRRWT